MQFPKLKNLFVSETCFRFCAIDLQISILALAIASKKRSKTISETCAKWSQFGAVSDTWGLAVSGGIVCKLLINSFLLIFKVVCVKGFETEHFLFRQLLGTILR